MTADPSSPQFDVACLGESMVTFVPAHSGRLADVPAFHRHIGGAESNVACTLAREGHTARWISRVGAEGFGDHLVEAIIAAGVDTSAVQRDHHRPTGIYFRTAGERVLFHPSDTVLAGPGRSGTVTAGGGSISGGWRSGGAAAGPRPVPDGPSDTERAPGEVVYYRAGSAASAMSPAAMRRADLWSGRILHLSGITAALSADCLALMRDLTTPAPGRPLVSFDVNYRVGLWQDASEDPAVLTELARGCDLVFVGEDEARAAWGLAGPDAVRAALPEPRVLVVKQGAAGATAYRREPDARTPSPSSRRSPWTSSPQSAQETPSPPDSCPRPCAACPSRPGSATATSWPRQPSPPPATSAFRPPGSRWKPSSPWTT